MAAILRQSYLDNLADICAKVYVQFLVLTHSLVFFHTYNVFITSLLSHQPLAFRIHQA